MSIKVLIADDYPILRYGLTAYLDRQPGPRGWGILRMGIKSCRKSKDPVLRFYCWMSICLAWLLARSWRLCRTWKILSCGAHF